MWVLQVCLVLAGPLPAAWSQDPPAWRSGSTWRPCAWDSAAAQALLAPSQQLVALAVLEAQASACLLAWQRQGTGSSTRC